ncbi:Lipoprotein [Salmonella enterica subsp. enterica]|uniref:Lipoprotein n=1 Tax=Salmonella enterica I TaxID=59201 RepID=A0A447TSW9_SALET|nr:Lipoprotein [Salmonella enterica subsp. enterica]
MPADALQPLIPAAQIFTQQLVQVGDYIAQQGEQVSFCRERHSVPDLTAGQPI